MTNWAILAGKLADDLPKLRNIWVVKLKILLMNRKDIFTFQYNGTIDLFSTLWIRTVLR